MQTPTPNIFTKGIDRSIAPLLADKRSLYTLRNLRHSFESLGVLEQTPYWYDYATFARGTYYNGGSLTEPATSAIRMITEDLIVTDYVCRGTSGQLQVFYQTTYPAAETIYTGCRLVINHVANLAITLGSTLDVEMTGAAAFRWRKNGGGWTAGVPSTAGVSIDSGNATLYFLASSGFAGTEAWAWTRNDRSWAATGTFDYPCFYEFYKNELFFNSVDDRIMVCTRAVTSNTLYVISVGYRPVVGTYVTFFDDHLIVGWFNKDVTSGWTTSTRHRVVGWSDKTDVYNFISTDTNEADQYTLPINNEVDTVTTSYNSFIMGVASVQQQLFVFTNNEIYTSPAYGLPIVFSFLRPLTTQLSSVYGAVVKGEGGVFLLAYNDILFFNGAELRSIGGPVVGGTDSNNFEETFGVWDAYRKELVFSQNTLLFCYQTKWDAWYVRQADFDSSTQPVKCISSYSGRIAVGLASLKTRREDTTGINQPIYDATDGTVYAEPYLVTQLYGDDLSILKELSSVFLGAIVDSSGISTTYYTTGNNVVVQLSHWVCNMGDFINVSEVAPTSATWQQSNTNGIISFPAVPYRAIAIALEIQGTAAKPPFKVTINQLTPLIYNREMRRIGK